MTHVGKRVATERKLAGLNQDQLAQRAGYSKSMVKAVEQGREPASPGFIAAVVGALHIEPEQLLGTPYYETIESEGPLEGLAELRGILAEGAYVRAMEPPPLSELTADMAAVSLAVRNDRTRLALARLPILIRKLYGALHDATSDNERDQVYLLLCSAYTAAEGCCCRLGFMSLANLILDRLDWAAANSGDPLHTVRSLMKRARLLMSYDSTDVGMSLVDRGLHIADGEDESARVIRGYSHLRGAIVAARGRRLGLATQHIDAARELARPMTRESDLYGTMFGPGNVEIHACAIELEAGDPGKAARDGSALRLPADVAPPRAAHHWQDTARAWLLVGEPDKALKALNMARQVAPQQTRLHPSVRETLYGIAESERRRTESLGNFARWVGINV